jgi:hypothetical protein
MSNMHQFDTGDGESVALNSLQLYALLNLPAQNASWPTYWALRRRELITTTAFGVRTELTDRGKAVVAHYFSKKAGDGSQA